MATIMESGSENVKPRLFQLTTEIKHFATVQNAWYLAGAGQWATWPRSDSKIREPLYN
ncbi:hypothetical protein TrispH2_005940 [Trichoplax sp. H2]|nr:hypothetical protein TrispH2_005940 [Trichoplax sp. H2]|eukprot:RDD41112.1 hypothetical protein TrispH2_005940 [Trichoplax sp. H2]